MHLHGAKRSLLRDPRSPIVQIFADGTDGFYFDGSKTDRTFQDTAGTIADDAGESIGHALESSKWSGRTLAARAAQGANLAPPFVSAGTGWTVTNTDGTHFVTFGTGSALFSVSSSTPITTLAASILTSGKVYKATIPITSYVSGQLKFDVVGTSYSIPAAAGVHETYFRANSASFSLYRVGAGVTEMTLGNITIQEVPGNHGVQTSSGARPTRQAGGVYRFDGLDDNLLTTLNPAASFAMLFKGKITSASKVVMGSRATTDTRALIGTDAAGLLAGGVGADSTTTIKGGSDIRGTTGVGALVFDASTVNLYWNGVSIYTGALNGSVNTTIPLRLGSFNDNGTASTFADADLYYALAIKKALTSAQIQAITNLWGTT